MSAVMRNGRAERAHISLFLWAVSTVQDSLLVPVVTSLEDPDDLSDHADLIQRLLYSQIVSTNVRYPTSWITCFLGADVRPPSVYIRF